MKLKNLLIVALFISTSALAQQFDTEAWSSAVSSQSSSSAASKDEAKNVDVPQSAIESCNEGPSTQKSLPMSVLRALGFDNLRVDVDYQENVVKISDSKIINNCTPMLTVGISAPKDGANYYALEVGIKGNCGKDDTGELKKTCPYKVKKSINSDPEEMFFEPSYTGFLKCLEATNAAVIEGDKVSPNPDGYQYNSFKTQTKVSGGIKSGPVYLKSQGYLAGTSDFPYGKIASSKCSFVEKLSSADPVVVSKSDADADNEYRRAQAVCKNNNYLDVNEEINKFTIYQRQIEQWRDKLLIDRAKEVAALLKKNPENVSDDDVSVLADFQQYIIGPLLDKIYEANEKIKKLTGSGKKKAQEELKALLAQLQGYTKDPYFLKDYVAKLESVGKFAAALNLQSIVLTADAYKFYGQKVNGLVVSSAVADASIEKQLTQFAADQKNRAYEYEIRTGQVTGVAQSYADDANFYQEQVLKRSQAYLKTIQVLAQQKYQDCYVNLKYYQSRDNCLAEKDQIKAAYEQQILKKNASDVAKYQQSVKNASYYADLEQQGRRYLASQDGEDISVDTKGETILKGIKSLDSIKVQLAQDAQQIQGGLMQQMNQPQQQGMSFNGQAGFNGSAGFNAGFAPQMPPQYYQQGFQGFPNQFQAGANGGLSGGLTGGNVPNYGYGYQAGYNPNYFYGQQPMYSNGNAGLGGNFGLNFNLGFGAGAGAGAYPTAYNPGNYSMLGPQYSSFAL